MTFFLSEKMISIFLKNQDGNLVTEQNFQPSIKISKLIDIKKPKAV